MRIREAKKHTDPTDPDADPDPQQCCLNVNIRIRIRLIDTTESRSVGEQ